MKISASSKILWFFAIVIVIPIVLSFSNLVFSAGSTKVLGEAQVMNTSGRIYFNEDVFNSNVVISDPDPQDNNKRTISGYAWSDDFGWIKFTSGETSGVFVEYSTGVVTGQAYVMNTAGIIDFSGNESNAIINPTSGEFSGYVWSDDVGWINLNGVYIEDSQSPTNPASISAYESSERTREISSGIYNFHNYVEPYFEWTGEYDNGSTTGYVSGIGGYYVYWGEDETAIPSQMGSFQTANNFTPSEVLSGTVYHLRIQSVDEQGNIFVGELPEYEYFIYNADLDAPRNVSYLIVPNSNFQNINDIFFSWPSDVNVSSNDDYSGVLGWQYSIGDANSWTGTNVDEALGIEYLPFEESTYTHNLTMEKDSSKLHVGNNIIYFRTVDNAGNFSSYVTGAISYGGEAPWFAPESSVTVTPNINTSNDFGLSWPTANTSEGRNISTYYYMVNTTPPNSYSTLISNSSLYIPIVGNSVSSTLLKGSVKGSDNTVYVVAVDDQSAYSASNYISGTYTLNSSLPDPVRNLTLSDSSVKTAELWRASLNWEEPEYKGNGNISYIVQRSLNGTSWIQVGSSQGLSYTDIVSAKGTYYYRIGVVDSTDESQGNPTFSPYVSGALQGRFTEAATLASKVVVQNVSTRHATISWVTGRESDTKIMYGIASEDYFKEEVYYSEQTTDHSIQLSNLTPDTTYYFKAKWTDIDGNTGVSSEISFRTDPQPSVEAFEVERVGLNYAIISFTTKGASKASVLFGRTLSYSGVEEINTSPSRSSYSVMLKDLSDGVLYNYSIRLTDSEGYIYDSLENHTFNTPPMPKISNVFVEEVVGVASPTVRFEWESNTEVNSIISYYPQYDSNRILDKVALELVSGKHSMEVSGLIPDTKYIAVVEGVDSLGNKAVSDSLVFTTATDTRPPVIENVKVEGTLLSRNVQIDRSRSAQLIISWETDEPSSSRIEYGEGTSGSFSSSTQTDSELRTDHLVIISGLTPSKVYNLKILSVDQASNIGTLGPVISITPKSSNSVYDTVFKSLANIFSFFQ